MKSPIIVFLTWFLAVIIFAWRPNIAMGLLVFVLTFAIYFVVRRSDGLDIAQQKETNKKS